jgi:transcriptional regulator with XRE-family HTH domain
MDRPGLADFLRRRREALQPRDVGLPDGLRRRTAGLRREEVASLAGMSADYWSRLEQQRGPQPSEQMLTAIARALRLTLDERDHLFRLAARNTPDRLGQGDHVHPALLRVLDRLDDTPAQVVSDLGETLVQNHGARALLGDQTRYAGMDRSAFYRWFTLNPVERTIYPQRDHARHSRIWAADLRAAVGRGNRPAREMVDALLATSPEFVATWELHEVSIRTDQRKTLVHPELGEIDLDCQILTIPDGSQRLLVFTATPGTPDAEKLELLSVVGTQFAQHERAAATASPAASDRAGHGDRLRVRPATPPR